MDAPPPADPIAPNAWQQLLRQFRELGEYASYYTSAKADSAKLSLRTTVLWLVLGGLGFVVVCGMLVTASYFMMLGLAGGLTEVFGARPWVGDLLTGALLFVGLGGGTYGTVVASRRASREKTVAAYKERQAHQEACYGHNVDQRAEAVSSQK